MLSNHTFLKTIIVTSCSFSGFYISFPGLLCKKACSFHAFHWVIRATLLNESNHSLVTFWVKWVFTSHGNWLEFWGVIIKWILRDFTFDIVSKVREESQPIIKLYHQCLGIDRRPSSRYSLPIEWCLNIILVHQVYFPNILLSKLKFVVTSNELEPVWQLMSANLIDFE